MKVFLRTLFFLVLSVAGLNAQSVWTGDVDSDWQNAANWVGGVPTSGVTATLPGSPQGGNSPVYSGGPIIDFSIQNAGTLTFNTLVYNNGDLINFVGGTINNDGQFYNSGGGTIDNDGFFNNNATFINYGSFDSALSGETTVAAGATFSHAGSFFKSAGPFINNGTVINTANMRSTNLFDNMGTLINKNSFESPFGSTFNLHGSGSLVNEAGTVFVINGAFTFDAGFTNDGIFSLQSAAIGNAMMPIINNNDFEVSGTLNNQSTFTNNSTLAILDGGEMTNSSVLDNNGTITLAICGALVQNASNTIQGPVLNDGLIYILNGDVNWTNIEFGNEFSDLNQTKPPVAGCINGFVYLDENGQGTLTTAQIDKGSYGACGASIANLSLSKTQYTTADIGQSTVTMTVEDNLGVISTCEGIVSVFAYVPPVVPVDDPSITFECPEDVTASTLPGANTTVVTWTEPTNATSDCVGASACADRTASNTTSCHNAADYGFYLKLEGEDFQYAISGGSFKEYEDGSATFTAHVTNNGNSAYQFDLVANLSGRTFVAPAGSPKAHSCLTADYSDWYYYENLTGSLTGTNGLAGASIALNTYGASFQIGTGANVTSTTNDYGASGWLSATINAQPTNGPNLAIADVGNGQAGDINIMLSGNSAACAPAVQCQTQTEIPGFIYMGEFNNSKYYCSNTNNFTWAQANSAAQAAGGHLAIVNDMAENNFLQNGLLADYAWIGLTDEVSEGNFQWVIPGASNFFNWNEGEPNNSGGDEDYTRILKSNGKWTDRNASFLAEVIVEIPCSNSDSNNSCKDVTVEITFDNYPEDISWKIEDENGDVVISGGNYGNEPDQSTISQSTCLTDGCYNFVLSDSFGDGLCCAYGAGSYSVTDVDGNILASGAEFTTGVTTNFCVTTESNNPVGPPTITQISGPANGAAFFAGVTEIAYEVADDCGNVEVCIFNVEVEATPSEITLFDCPGNIVINTLPGATSAVLDWTAPTASTTCFNDGLVLKQTEGPEVGDVLRVKDGAQQVAYVATDSCNNFQACVFSVQVIATPSAITMADCPGNISVVPAEGANAATVTWDLPTATTSCFTDLIFVEQVAGPAPGSTLAAGTTETVIYILNDECGNSEICIFNVSVDSCPVAGTACDDGDSTTVNDQEDGNCNCAGEPSFLEIDCQADITVATAPGVASAIVNFDLPTVSTNCPDGYTLDQTAGGESGTSYPTGITTVSYSATDACGNTATCSFDVLVVAGTSTVTIECLEDIIVTAAPGAATALVDWVDPVATTDCASGNVFFLLEQGGGPGFNYPLGTSTIEYNFYDECGGVATCQFTVTVNDGGCVDADGDGVCAADDCDDNDANLPAAPGTTCDDGDATTENDVIGADGCSCAGTTIDPCAAAGGDADGDGICAADDCDDNDANFPMAIGTPCDDNDDSTENDVIGADGCSCAGTQIDPCDVLGGDADGDGVCAMNDCDDNDANFPMAPGSTCDDGDATTENDMIGADGCSCAGTPINNDPDCNDIQIVPGNSSITISGLTAPVTTIQVFNASWSEVFKCAGNCDPNIQVITGLAAETHFVKVAFYTANWQPICSVEDYYQVTAGDPCENSGGDADGDGTCAADDCDDNDASIPAAPGTTCDDGDAATINDVIGADGCSCAGVPNTGNPCENSGGDADGDGTCAADDCDDTDASIPAAPGTTCDDGDVDTENDVIGADGCSCAGTPIVVGPDCASISVTTGDGSIIVSGLDGAPISSVQIFDETWSQVFKCIADCGETETITGLMDAHNYFVKVAFYDASWNLICDDEGYYKVYASGNDPCENAGGDADGDGVCAADDCDDNNASLPAAPGTSCDDGDSNTVNDEIGADGCTCAGVIPGSGPDCANVSITTGDGTITVAGLEFAPITSIQIFDAGWAQVFKCAGNCDPSSEVIADLATGTYFVKVSYYDASWQPICSVEDFYAVTSTGGLAPQNKVSVDFYVEKNERIVDLAWGSNRGPATEMFEIEKSLDGENFEKLISQENEYFGSATMFYTGVDEQPEEGWNYYRLKETLIDGSIEYSEPRKVHFMADFEKIMLFPNPTIDVAYLHLKAFVDMDVTIDVYDNLGQLVLRQNIERAPNAPVELNIEGLQAGTYHVSVKTDKRKRATTKLVVLRD